MRSSELRLGNIVAAIDQPDQPDYVLVLEPGTIHLMSRPEADDELNIVPVAATPEVLSAFEIPCNSWFSFSEKQVMIEVGDTHMLLHIGDAHFPFQSVHELQNLLHIHCGDDIIRHPHIHQDMVVA